MRILLIALFLFSRLHAEEEPTITHHTIQLKSGSFRYSAIAGTLPLTLSEEIGANIFFVAYIKDLGEDERPITFVFPGGPGGAGTAEAIVSIGPRRLLTASEGRSILPPYKFIDNPETLLESTDLVFVDPVNCGFSRFSCPNEQKEETLLSYFYSTEGDLQTLAYFVRRFVTTFDRVNSPKYLAGSSYGSTRCCGLPLSLLEYDILLNGIIIDGCAIDWSAREGKRNRPLPDCLLIPTFAATAWYHGRLWPEKPLVEVIDYSRRFAFDHYAPVMLQPNRLGSFEQNAFFEDLAHLIGLPVNTVKKYNGRIDEAIYTAEFFSPARKVLGGIDTRYSGDSTEINPFSHIDPSYNDSYGVAAAFQIYLQKELDIVPTDSYISFSHKAFSNWDFSTFDSNSLPDFLQRLRTAMVCNPRMQIFVGSGYYDARTPFAATEYCFDHLDLPFTYRDNLQFEYYEAGHGFMFDHPSLMKWKKDLTRFYAK